MKSQKIVSAGFIVYKQVGRKIKFLLLYRGRDVWDMPRGRMRADEKSLQTAFREVYEETGLHRRHLKFDRKFHRLYEKFPYWQGENRVLKIVIFYLAEATRFQVKLSKEHEGYAWFTLKEAFRHLGRYRKRKEILKKAWEYIRNKQLSQNNLPLPQSDKLQ